MRSGLLWVLESFCSLFLVLEITMDLVPLETARITMACSRSLTTAVGVGCLLGACSMSTKNKNGTWLCLENPCSRDIIVQMHCQIREEEAGHPHES